MMRQITVNSHVRPERYRIVMLDAVLCSCSIGVEDKCLGIDIRLLTRMKRQQGILEISIEASRIFTDTLFDSDAHYNATSCLLCLLDEGYGCCAAKEH